jgi:hypothetical protein
MAAVDRVFAVVAKSGIVEICSTKTAAETTAESVSGAEVQEYKLKYAPPCLSPHLNDTLLTPVTDAVVARRAESDPRTPETRALRFSRSPRRARRTTRSRSRASPTPWPARVYVCFIFPHRDAELSSFSPSQFHFIGTAMKLTHAALGESASNHGGTVEKKLEDADYVVTGKIGDAQQKTIDEHGLVTITEAEFKVGSSSTAHLIYVNHPRTSLTHTYHRNGSRPATSRSK